MSEEAAEHDWAGPPGLRIASAVSFIPAFPLCLAHGVASRGPGIVPAIGLVPLAFSSAAGVFLATKSAHHDKFKHPALIFASDVVLAAALMVVLVYTWLTAPQRSASFSMLAAYATIPLLFNL